MASIREKSPPLSDDFSRRATRLYTDPSRAGALGGIARLARELGASRRTDTLRWSRGFDAYNLHRPSRRKFKRRKTIVRGPGVQLQADLVDVGAHASANGNVKFLLTIVDVFSRRAWVEPLHSKRGADVVAALSKNLKGLGYETLQTDKGREFFNSDVYEFLTGEGIKHFATENDDIKASIVERFNRSLRQKIHTLLTYDPDAGYLRALPDLVDAYNRTPHGSTGKRPIDVDESNAEDIFLRLYEEEAIAKSSAPPKERLYSGDHVRIGKSRRAFERGYTPNWTREIFIVRSYLSWTNPPVYTIEDMAGERIAGTFYERELQRVEAPKEFRIERIIKSRGRGEKREHLVKWLGYPDSFNSWISSSDFV